MSHASALTTGFVLASESHAQVCFKEEAEGSSPHVTPFFPYHEGNQSRRNLLR